MLIQRDRHTDPYDSFKIWCLQNGFRDLVRCKSKDVDLDRLKQAINLYIPPHRARGNTGFHPITRARGNA